MGKYMPKDKERNNFFSDINCIINPVIPPEMAPSFIFDPKESSFFESIKDSNA
jgi:hypothetical protein